MAWAYPLSYASVWSQFPHPLQKKKLKVSLTLSLNERGTWEMTAVPHKVTSVCSTQNKQITNSSNHCIGF